MLKSSRLRMIGESSTSSGTGECKHIINNYYLFIQKGSNSSHLVYSIVVGVFIVIVLSDVIV